MKNYYARFKSYQKHMSVRSALSVLVRGEAGLAAPIPVRFNGFPPFFVRPTTTDLAMAIDVLSRTEYDFPLQRSPRLIVDAGANTGAAAVFFKTKYPQAKVVSIEPEPANFRMLQKNVENLSCETIQSAVWSRKTILQLDYSEGAECAVMTAERGQDSGTGAVPTVTIDELVDKYGSIDILKLDVEGAEFQLFESAAPAWLEHVQVIMIELHDRYVPGCSRRFFRAVEGFPEEAVRGENFCVAKPGWLHVSRR